ncbi:rhodanese-like domain-containing protein [Streptomyces sp. NPDC093085]|uniref:rhodanese-like domain-containing protein n=1 Tax=Streptomyces sp. NPDC093085 TaxID=3155068 RepID=UPI00342A2670
MSARTEFSSPHGGPDRLRVEQAHRSAGQGEVALLDVREAPEWEAGHAPGALHLPLSRLTAGAPLPAAALGRPVTAICRSGRRSEQAAWLLFGRGVEATDVEGGMAAWAEAGLPVVAGQDGSDEHGGGGVIA